MLDLFEPAIRSSFTRTNKDGSGVSYHQYRPFELHGSGILARADVPESRPFQYFDGTGIRRGCVGHDTFDAWIEERVSNEPLDNLCRKTSSFVCRDDGIAHFENPFRIGGTEESCSTDEYSPANVVRPKDGVPTVPPGRIRIVRQLIPEMSDGICVVFSRRPAVGNARV